MKKNTSTKIGRNCRLRKSMYLCLEEIYGTHFILYACLRWCLFCMRFSQEFGSVWQAMCQKRWCAPHTARCFVSAEVFLPQLGPPVSILLFVGPAGIICMIHSWRLLRNGCQKQCNLCISRPGYMW